MSAPRHMLPGGLLHEPGAKRTARDWIVDATMLAFAVAIGGFALGNTEDLHPSDDAVFFDLLLGLAAIVPLWWRRRYPFAVAVLAITPGVISAFAAGAGIVALFNVALRGSRRAIAVAVALTLVTVAVFPLLYDDPRTPYLLDLALAVLSPAAVVAWGLFARTQRELLRSSHERALRAEQEQRAHVERAREAERRRIAGEMHDVLAHRLSLLSVHAGALEFRPDAPPEEIAAAAAVVRENAHAALQELREVIGVLREDQDGPPQPTLEAIPRLIEESRAAGMRVRARIDGGGDARLGRTAYRVVQEGLTNARKHAPAALVDVTVDAGEALVVEVVSRPSTHAPPPKPGGTGLIGLSERVTLAGGELHYGRAPSGDFVLRATLPRP